MNNITIFTAVYVLLLWWAYRSITDSEKIKESVGRKETIIFAALIFVITAFKVWLSSSFYGHSSDMSLFSAWSYVGAEGGLSEFYGAMGKEYYVDYPPIYLYVLTVVGKVSALFNISYGSNVHVAVIKFIPILADTVTSLLVFKKSREEFSDRQSALLALLVLLNPAYILNSSIWGQIDGLYSLIIIWLLFSVYKKKYFEAVLSFSVGILTKPQMIIFLPLLGFWWILDVYTEYKEEKSFKSLKYFLFGTLASVVLAVILAFPMVKFDIKKFYDIYRSAAGQYPYATLNAANIFGAFGKNWALYSEKFLGITFENWGFIFIILSSLAIGLGTFFAHNRKGVFILGGFNVLSIFMFAHTMHERYSFPLILVLLITYIITNDKRMFFAFGASSVLSFIQTGIVLLNNEGIINLSSSAFIMLSWINLVFYGYMVTVWFKMLIFDNIKTPKTHGQKLICITPEEKKITYTRKDGAIVFILTVFYAVTAFYNLGSLNTAQKGYEPYKNGESVVVDFGKEQDIHRVNMFIGLIARRSSDSEVIRNLKISFGIDTEGEEIVYGDETEIEIDSVFAWAGFFANQRGRFMKITSDEGDFLINEVACFDSEKNLLTPVGTLSDNATAKFLIDEQDTAVYEYTWFDGTYFDEIYHPRTAYEYINGISPYENTHPPLGKLIISLGMMLFGVTPFGWRFFGTLFGVLMVPVIYALSKQILKETKWATVSAFLFTFDFMHLAQTRLATIDSFTAFFVMLMYYYMYKYVKMNFYNTGVLKTLKPLFLSGLFFGIGVAVKWQGAYAGAGLCVMFFMSLYKRFTEFKAAKDGRLVGDSEKIIKEFPMKTAKTIGFAFLFFVVVPFAVYFLSYLPIILSDNETLSYFWENQKSMFGYHSNLTEAHPYGSPWWSWPLNLRPLYAYNPNRDFVPEGISQGITTFGNPLVWWLAIPAIVYLIYHSAKKGKNTEINTILTGFGAMYLPWILVSRQAFIYHFFPCVPFVALGIAYSLRELMKKYEKLKIPAISYLALVFLLYIAFYPVLTGIKIPDIYAEMLSWLPSWVLG